MLKESDDALSIPTMDTRLTVEVYALRQVATIEFNGIALRDIEQHDTGSFVNVHLKEWQLRQLIGHLQNFIVDRPTRGKKVKTR